MDASILNSLSLDVAAANQGQFRLAIAGLNANDVTFVNMRSNGHAISEDYCFDINLQLRQAIDISKYIGAAAYFEILDNSGPIYIHGVVSAMSFMGHRPDGESYFVQMHSMLFPLKNNLQNRVFLNKDAKQILEEVLLGAKFNTAEFEFKTQGSYPVREFTVQYDESDYDFISRIMAHEGIFYVIEQTDKGAKIVIYDHCEDLPSFTGGELMFERQTGTMRSSQTVFTFNRQYSLLSEDVRLKDYNYRTPEVKLETTATRTAAVSSSGHVCRYGENFKTLDEGSRVAKLRQQVLDWQREVFVADTDCRGLRPGMSFTLVNHPNDGLNGDYLILQVEHRADQGAGHARGPRPSSMTYRNQLTLIKAGIPYRSAVPDTRYINGIFTCMVETTGGDYAYLDEQGRYHLRMPYDLSTTSDGQASHPVRQAQTYSGQDYGMHFPLHAGTEVIVTCLNGDIDRPIMLGAVHNPESPNLVTSSNHSQNILRSWGNNELLMEDRKGEERIDLFTGLKKNILSLDAKQSEHHIYLGTEEGEMEQYAAKTMHIESGDSMTIQSGNDHILTVENAHSLMTNNKEIEFKAKTDIRHKASNNIILQSETENFEMRVGKDMVVDVKNNLSLEVRNKDLSIIVTNGNFEIKAAKSITVKGQGGGNITVSQAGGSVVIDTSGAITIAGSTVNIDGNAVYLKGASVKQGGGGSGSGASGSQSGTSVQNLRLAAADLFTQLAQQAQEIASSITSPNAKQNVQNEDLTVTPVADGGGSATDKITGGMKQAWQQFKCKQAGVRAEWFAEQGMNIYTDTNTGKRLSPQEVGEMTENNCIKEIELKNTAEVQGAETVENAPETATAIAVTTALLTKGRSVIRDPKDFANDMKSGLGKGKKKTSEKDKKDNKKKCEYQLSAAKKCSKPLNKTCPLKNKNKRKKGNNNGNSTTLSNNIMKNTSGTTSVINHSWYYKGNSIAAHHLICSESVSGSKWKNYFDICGYDINHHNNGVMLPSTLESACQLKAPLHRSNHSQGVAKNKGSISYVKAVKDEVDDVAKNLKKNRYCSNPKGLEDDMNSISKDILQYIDHYIWTLTVDGDDYAPTSARGCANADGIPGKNNNNSDCSSHRHHQLRHAKTNQLLVKNGPLRVGA